MAFETGARLGGRAYKGRLPDELFFYRLALLVEGARDSLVHLLSPADLFNRLHESLVLFLAGGQVEEVLEKAGLLRSHVPRTADIGLACEAVGVFTFFQAVLEAFEHF